MYTKAIAIRQLDRKHIFKNSFINGNKIVKYLNIHLEGNIFDLMRKMTVFPRYVNDLVK